MAGAAFPSRPIKLSGEQLVRRNDRDHWSLQLLAGESESAVIFLDRTVDRYPFDKLVGIDVHIPRGQRRHRVRAARASAAGRPDRVVSAAA